MVCYQVALSGQCIEWFIAKFILNRVCVLSIIQAIFIFNLSRFALAIDMYTRPFIFHESRETEQSKWRMNTICSLHGTMTFSRQCFCWSLHVTPTREGHCRRSPMLQSTYTWVKLLLYHAHTFHPPTGGSIYLSMVIVTLIACTSTQTWLLGINHICHHSISYQKTEFCNTKSDVA